MVGWVVGWSAPWVLWPFQVVVVLVYGRLWAAGIGWWAVVVVVGVVPEVMVAVVVVVVLWARPQDPLVFRWDMAVGHRLQPYGLHGLVDSGGGFGAGLGKERGGGVPRPRVGLACGGVGLWGIDGWVFGDWDVAPGLDGVVLCGCLRGGSPCLGQGGAGCCGGGVVVAGALLALLPLVWLLGVRVLVLVVLVVLVVLWWALLLFALGFRLLFGFGLWLGNRLEVGEDLILEMWGERCRAVLLLPGCWGGPRGGLGASGGRVRDCGYGCSRGLVGFSIVMAIQSVTSSFTNVPM